HAGIDAHVRELLSTHISEHAAGLSPPLIRAGGLAAEIAAAVLASEIARAWTAAAVLASEIARAWTADALLAVHIAADLAHRLRRRRLADHGGGPGLRRRRLRRAPAGLLELAAGVEEVLQTLIAAGNALVDALLERRMRVQKAGILSLRLLQEPVALL